MSIIPKEKELTAVAISVAAGCKPCTNYHFRAVQEAGASDEEIKQAIVDALNIRERATELMKAHALAHLGTQGQTADAYTSSETNRVRELGFVGAAFAVNCTTNLKKHLVIAETVGISAEEIDEVIRLALFIKNKAASHVERLVGLEEKTDASLLAESI